MLICPILIIMAGSVTVFVTTQITLITTKVALLGFFSFFIFFIPKILPYCLVWGLFTFIYIFMPNTKVNFRSGLLAGVFAGTIYELSQLVYINFQVGVAKYNAIYGSFAALPLFLVWLQVSWLIVLFGAEISFANQNVHMYEFEPDSLKISFFFKKLLSLEITHLLIMSFAKGERPLTASQISHSLRIPIRLVHQILYELVESGIFSETNTGKSKELAYQPARDIKIFTIKYITDALEQRGVDNIPVAQTRELKILSEMLQEFREMRILQLVEIPPDTFITGSSGGNDVASCAREILVTALQSKGRYVERVPYITSPGIRVRTLVSDKGVFEKPEGEEEFILMLFISI